MWFAIGVERPAQLSIMADAGAQTVVALPVQQTPKNYHPANQIIVSHK
jgi:hypothetical protein